MEDLVSLKKKIYNACQDIIDRRFEMINTKLSSIREAKNNETKSSAGDKYETGRAMMQMEEEKYNMQLVNAYNLKIFFSNVDAGKLSDSIGPGTLAITSNGLYYFSIGLGKVEVDGNIFFCISKESPIGRLMIHKKEGDSFYFNNKKIDILKIT